MSDIIRLLPESLANQIAAGEVVPAPAYLVKELVENSIDAGATQIQIEVIGAGRQSIAVTDNGKGMSPTDARMAFERHATSKLQTIEDLQRLSTMGFRGEALAAIAAVCQVELRTRTAEHDVGTELIIEGTKVRSQMPVACAQGTSLKAMNIFYNTPGRRKHLEARKESTELMEIWREFAKVALANPQIAFTLRGAGKYDKILPASSLKERIIDIGGARLSRALIPVSYESAFCTIRGFIGTPTTSLKQGAQQYLFVNDRFIRHPYFHKAITLAYENFIPAGNQPQYFLYFTIPAENIDVNIHPQKTDVRFLDESTIFPILQSLIRDAFSAHALTPIIDFENASPIEIPAYTGRKEVLPDINQALSAEAFLQSEGEGGATALPSGGGRLSGFRLGAARASIATKEPEISWNDLGEHFDSMTPLTTQPPLFDLPAEEPHGRGIRLSQAASLRIRPTLPTALLLYQSRYVITTLGDALAFIDLTRAVLRITYEQYRTDLSAHSYRVEQPLFPEVLEFAPQELPTAHILMEELQHAGFDFGDLGDGHFSIVEAPSFISQDATGFVRLIVADSLDTHREGAEYVQSFLAEAAAESTALQRPLPQDNEGLEQLIRDLFQSSDPYFTPSGKPIITRLTEPMVANFFN
ncbi:DNA mismatch repair endonuclease MutL [Porphyromonas sp.]